jgi:hypothetical protein
MNKVQLSLTSEEAAILSSFGSQFGYSLPKTIRFVISKSVEEFLKQGVMPVYPMSKKTEETGLKAMDQHRLGQTRKIDNIDEFLVDL